jgi:hypothetical protein
MQCFAILYHKGKKLLIFLTLFLFMSIYWDGTSEGRNPAQKQMRESVYSDWPRKVSVDIELTSCSCLSPASCLKKMVEMVV